MKLRVLGLVVSCLIEELAAGREGWIGSVQTVMNHARPARAVPSKKEKVLDLPKAKVAWHTKHVVYIIASSSTSCIGSNRRLATHAVTELLPISSLTF